jgi:hypothetical protein
MQSLKIYFVIFSPVLDMPAFKVKVRSLKFYLDEAIVFCNFPLEELNILHNMKVELSQINEPCSTVWDVFTLKYEVEPDDPISLVYIVLYIIDCYYFHNAILVYSLLFIILYTFFLFSLIR